MPRRVPVQQEPLERKLSVLDHFLREEENGLVTARTLWHRPVKRQFAVAVYIVAIVAVKRRIVWQVFQHRPGELEPQRSRLAVFVDLHVSLSAAAEYRGSVAINRADLLASGARSPVVVVRMLRLVLTCSTGLVVCAVLREGVVHRAGGHRGRKRNCGE